MTTLIWGAHGAVRGSQPEQFSHRNFLDYDAVHAYLSSRRPKFVPLANALDQGGEALTIDDATVGARTLALAAIEHGHAVTVFVTGDVTSRELPYTFHVLNAALDRAKGATCVLNGETLPLDEHAVKSIVRRWIKGRFSAQRGYDRRRAIVNDFARSISAEGAEVAEHARTLSTGELRALADAGVQLENHGWEHADMSRWSSSEQEELVRRGHEFLETHLGLRSRFFAVPFGEAFPASEGKLGDAETWLLLTKAVPLGLVASRVVNRRTLKVP